MPVAIESFEVVPEAEQPQRSAQTQERGGAPMPASQIAKQIEQALRTREARLARLRAT